MEEEQIITQEGYNKLKEEFDHRSNAVRPEIAQRIEAAKELGDLSENAEYHQAKEDYAFNEGRINELSALLKKLTIVNCKNGSTAGLGSVVKVKSAAGKKEYKIVSFNEADPVSGKISNESPLGKAFLGRRVGDRVNVSTPKGEAVYEILDIE